jgi:hypothetical protein
MPKQLISIRVSDTGRALLDALTEHFGVTQAATVEMALRELARKEGLKIPDKKEPDNSEP